MRIKPPRLGQLGNGVFCSTFREQNRTKSRVRRRDLGGKLNGPREGRMGCFQVTGGKGSRTLPERRACRVERCGLRGGRFALS